MVNREDEKSKRERGRVSATKFGHVEWEIIIYKSLRSKERIMNSKETGKGWEITFRT